MLDSLHLLLSSVIGCRSDLNWAAPWWRHHPVCLMFTQPSLRTLYGFVDIVIAKWPLCDICRHDVSGFAMYFVRQFCDGELQQFEALAKFSISCASCSHLFASVTKQYNLVPAKGQWCSAAGKVTAGLAESEWEWVSQFILRALKAKSLLV